MRIGIPTEIKADENRVAITPSCVAAFAARGHEVVIEAGAGVGSAIPDHAYRAAGRRSAHVDLRPDQCHHGIRSGDRRSRLARGRHARPALAKGMNLVEGQLTHAAVAAAHGLDCAPLDQT